MSDEDEDHDDDAPFTYMSPEERAVLQRWKNMFMRQVLGNLVQDAEAAKVEAFREGEQWTPEQLSRMTKH